MKKGINLIAVATGVIAFPAMLVGAFFCLNTVVYALMAPEPTLEETVQIEVVAHPLITKAE